MADEVLKEMTSLEEVAEQALFEINRIRVRSALDVAIAQDVVNGIQQAQASSRVERKTTTVVVERPAGTPWQLPPVMPPDDYLAKAKTIRLNTPKIVEARLDRFLVDRGWLVYDYERVMAYLRQLAEKERPEAAKAARENPLPTDFRSYPEFRRFSMLRAVWLDYPRIEVCWSPLRPEDGFDEQTVYEHPVPAHALDKVYALEEEFGPKVLSFFVSDYKAVTPDPFLLVRAHPKDRGKVIDVWDEPGWGV